MWMDEGGMCVHEGGGSWLGGKTKTGDVMFESAARPLQRMALGHFGLPACVCMCICGPVSDIPRLPNGTHFFKRIGRN